MGQVQQQPPAGRSENPAANGAHEKGGAGIVAKDQQPLCLPGADPALLRELCQIGRAHGIAAAEADEKGCGPGAGDAEEPLGDGTEKAPQLLREIQLSQQQRDRKEGKERGQDQLRAQAQPPGSAGDHLPGGGDQREQRTERDQDGQVFFHRKLLMKNPRAYGDFFACDSVGPVKGRDWRV